MFKVYAVPIGENVVIFKLLIRRLAQIKNLSSIKMIKKIFSKKHLFSF